MASHNQTGKLGEELAVEFLREKGYEILEKNWRKGYLEVDIIALDGKTLVMVEVKTRADLHHGLPEEAITRKKERLLMDAAEAYLELNDMNNEVRFDIIAVWDTDSNVRINHIQGAFTGMG
jgi:putative endonuclease